MEAFTFDPARPTSLLYKKTATGYELVGALYTMPKRATEDQLNERGPSQGQRMISCITLRMDGDAQYQTTIGTTRE